MRGALDNRRVLPNLTPSTLLIMRSLASPIAPSLAPLASLLGLAAGCAAPTPDSSAAQSELGALVTTAFQDGVAPTASYAGARDTMLEQHAPTAIHGADRKLSISGDTLAGTGHDAAALLQWDLAAAIPRNAIVRSARITLTVTDKADQTYSLFEVLRPWDEATATWRRASSLSTWALEGAAGATDRGATALGAIRAAAIGTYTIALGSAGVAAVQRWVADPATNHGILLAGATNDNRLEIQSREDARSGRPRLEVTWEANGTDGALDPAPGTYAQTCDGSGGVALDFTSFLNLSDEDQLVRVYARRAGGPPIQQLDLSASLGVASDDEVDFEDAARVGGRVYAISSHGRNKDGDLAPARYRFFALDLSGAVPSLQLAFAGSSRWLVEDMLDPASWVTPDPAVLAALEAATRLDVATDPSLAPEASGLNIEGLAALPSTGNPSRMVIGLRNPRASSGRALLVTLENPAEAVVGGFARFGQALQLDLGGLGVRSLAWSDAHQALLIVAGPPGDVGAVRLFKWSGDPAIPPTPVADLVAPTGAAAEAAVPYPGTKDVQILFDRGGQLVGGTECKKLSTSSQSFDDQIIHVD